MAEKKKLSFEESMEELGGIVARLESGEAGLEESLELFKKGVVLTEKCNKLLDEAEQKIKIAENGGKEE
ncbi:MAG: exodeoxyribonuclease VII small subunit [Bacillota bacterium]|nr:exodeoxyribonuclease VII small subunit [Bacillota bacterium]